METQPKSHQWMKLFIEAFNTLSATRQYGMGPNPIALTEMLAYMTIWETEDKDEFIHHMLAMDSAFLEAKARKTKREAEAREAEAAKKNQGK